MSAATRPDELTGIFAWLAIACASLAIEPTDPSGTTRRIDRTVAPLSRPAARFDRALRRGDRGQGPAHDSSCRRAEKRPDASLGSFSLLRTGRKSRLRRELGRSWLRFANFVGSFFARDIGFVPAPSTLRQPVAVVH
jgi:hypothetical protein